ncbi:alpha-L-arabinofuranosidase C-terminal domain-containing protein [Duncaniella sp.]|uniref:alpha-L-arabinofuranosidase C-terminal domain-containing protein n=1 Tax=Duncaniella sp. TaxID=2518496 RepID=UPI0023CF8406|nr:alpha-L-arabinofuranosidase C-terminal domain-containing protein [Duncaniella sp.]MDE5904146.1 carbohydrate binding domain-containing protein [Duncaniella sp.]
MKLRFRSTVCSMLAALAAGMTAHAEEFIIRTDRPGAEIQPTMYGLFFEDINYAADGGLYAEMVKNRSFEFPQNLMGWESFGSVALLDDGPFERNPHYVRLTPAPHKDKATGLTNEGFFGIAFRKGESYRFSLWARSTSQHPSKIRIELIDPSAAGETQVMASETIEIKDGQWQKYTTALTPSATVRKGKLRIFLDSKTGCDLEHISLFPAETWQGHENGLRKDLAQKLADIRPGLLRFPGGCIVEGTDLPTRYQWKNTVGPVENRPLNENRWHYTFRHRFFPDYYQSYGLGFFEYFRLAEEIGAEPLPVINVGLACQYQNKDPKAHVPADSLQPYIQDALDLIEFANGPTDSPWGKVRAEMGHPAPFNLRFLAIGNEQWGPEYPERLEPFVRAIRKACPEIKLVGSSGPKASGKEFDYLWPEMRRLKADLVDEHFYAPEEFFLSQATRYDSYPRKGPKVFAGEYACHGKGKKFNHFNASLLEAAFMTGLERNADVVHMATYAPLFAHTEGWQWRPDMIWFDNLGSVATASYYVQQLYASNKGSRVLPLTLDGQPVTGAEGQNGLYASAVTDDATGGYIVKIANTSDSPQEITLNFQKLKKGRSLTDGRVITLSAPLRPDGTPDLDCDNTLENPDRIIPVETALPASGNTASLTLPAKTFAVCRIPIAR